MVLIQAPENYRILYEDIARIFIEDSLVLEIN
jgi:hypothetical protein